MPPVPLLRDVAASAREALGKSLDTPAGLRVLRRLEVAPHVASGSKFAPFVYLDRVLGLDVGHLVGKLHR